MTQKISTLVILVLILFAIACNKPKDAEESNSGEKESNDEWISLFDGKSLEGWQASENKGTFTVKDGMIAVDGDRSHLFYMGQVGNHDFKNFEFKASIMTKPGANSGLFFHTEYQETGWPAKGIEVQVNNTQSDWRRTGSLYAIQDIRDTLAQDDQWFTQHIIVKDNKVTVELTDKVINAYTEPVSASSRISHGTVALQGHDPNSKVFYKDIMIKVDE